MRQLFDALCAVFCIGLATLLVGLVVYSAALAYADSDWRWTALNGALSWLMLQLVWWPVVSFFGSCFRGVKYED